MKNTNPCIRANQSVLLPRANTTRVLFLARKREGHNEGQSKAPPPLGKGVIQHPEGFDDGDAFMQKMRRQMMEKRKAMETSRETSSGRDSNDTGLKGGPNGFKGVGDGDKEAKESRGKKKAAAVGDGDDEGDDRPVGWRADDETDREKERRKAIRERAKEYEALREELKAKHRAVRVMTGEERIKYDSVSDVDCQLAIVGTALHEIKLCSLVRVKSKLEFCILSLCGQSWD